MVLARVRRGDAAGPPPHRLVVPLVLFGISALVSTLLSTSPAQSAARASYAPIAFVLFLAAQDVMVSPPAYRRVLQVLAAVVLLLGVDGTYQFATGKSLLGSTVPFRGRITGSLPHPNDLALIPILLPTALSLVTAPSSWTSRRILLGMPLPRKTEASNLR